MPLKFARSCRSRLSVSAPFGLALLSIACSPSSGESSNQGSWEVEHYRGVCIALWQTNNTAVAISLSPESEVSGINVSTDALIGMETGRFYPEISFKANGELISATTIATAPVGGGVPTVLFRFDPRTLVRNFPEGFSLSLVRNGQSIYSAELTGASSTFRQLGECAAKQQMVSRKSALQRPPPSERQGSDDVGG